MPNAPDNVIDLLQRMVQINSINPALTGSDTGEAALIDDLHNIASALNLTTRRLPTPDRCDQLLITPPNNSTEPTDKPWLLFDSHTDTVAVEGMTIDPFSGHIDDNKLFGRGACDTKGTAAAMLWALHEYTQAPNQPNNVALLVSIDEEVTMAGIQHFLNHHLPALNINPWGVIIGEPTDCHPVIAHNGCTRWTLTTHGVAAHSSVPHEGRSAISAAVKIIQTIESRYAPSLTDDHPLTGAPVCTVNMIHGGSAFNIIPDTCTLEIDRRVTPNENPQAIDPTLRYLLDTLDNVDYTMTQRINHPPLSPASSQTTLLPAVKHVLHDMSLPTLAPGAPFATHASYTAAANLPTLVLGPGSPHKAHTEDEWVATDAIELGVDMYRNLMRYNPSSP